MSHVHILKWQFLDFLVTTPEQKVCVYIIFYCYWINISKFLKLRVHHFTSFIWWWWSKFIYVSIIHSHSYHAMHIHGEKNQIWLLIRKFSRANAHHPPLDRRDEFLIFWCQSEILTFFRKRNIKWAAASISTTPLGQNAACRWCLAPESQWWEIVKVITFQKERGK